MGTKRKKAYQKNVSKEKKKKQYLLYE